MSIADAAAKVSTPRVVTVEHWFDFICPYCYIAQDRNQILREHGIHVVERALQIHPEIGPGGTQAGPRAGPTYDFLAQQAKAVGLPLNWPNRIAYSRPALAAHEWLTKTNPNTANRFLTSVFTAYFANSQNIESLDLLAELAENAGANPDQLRAALTSSAAADALAHGQHVESVDKFAELGDRASANSGQVRAAFTPGTAPGTSADGQDVKSVGLLAELAGADRSNVRADLISGAASGASADGQDIESVDVLAEKAGVSPDELRAALASCAAADALADGRDIESVGLRPELAGKAGATRDQLRAALTSSAAAEALAESETIAHAQGIHGTPTWTIQGQHFSGLRPREWFEELAIALIR